MIKMLTAGKIQSYMNRPHGMRLSRCLGFAVLGAVLLTGCGGAGTTSNPNTQTKILVTYTGPAASTTDIRNFQTSFWENLRASDRCGGCHDPASATPQTPYFARSDNVNLAYSAIMDNAANSLISAVSGLPYIDRSQASQSHMITKVRGPHNCWLGASQASICGDVINAFIDNWLGTSGTGSTKQIQLTPPSTLVDPGASKNYPAVTATGVTNFMTLPTPATSLYNLLNTHCAGCHVSTARLPQAPFFAESDATRAYNELKSSQKIDLDTPANSRIVVRVRDGAHNCWDPANCAGNASELQTAVAAFAASLAATPVASDLLYSKALKLSDAIIANGGNRYENNVIALYEFKRGTGNTAFDTSGVVPALDLSLSGNPGDISWLRGYGLQFKGAGKAQGSVVNSKKLFNAIKDIGEYSLETWVTAANVTQAGPAHIISYMGTANDRNFTLGQVLYEFTYHNRTNATLGDGGPASMTTNNAIQAHGATQHVVVTVDPVNGKQIYVNGIRVLQDASSSGTLVNWDNNFAFVLGNDQGRSKPWAGQIRLVAIHNRALSQTQITQNFKVGVGAKFFMLFNVKAHTCPGNTNASQCSDYIMFEASEFDNYSYLFTNPKFIRLSNDPLTANIRIRGMRLGMNGKEVAVGQAYRNIDVTINTTDNITAGVPLSALGTTIASQKGANGDEFFLTFEQLIAVSTHDYTEPGATGVLIDPAAPNLAPKPLGSDIGVRTFDEINAAMKALTGVDPYAGTAPNRIIDEYNTVKQQLPSVENMSGFLSAHQMGVAQLSISYCNALVNDPSKRSTFFGGFNFAASVDMAFNTAGGDSAEKNQVVNALYNKMIGLPGTGTALTTAPSLAEVKGILIGPASVNTNNIFDRLYSGCQSNTRLDGSPRNPVCVQDSARTQAMLKAMCAATLGSAAMLVQ